MPMTTEQIAPLLQAHRARIRELTETEQALEKSLASGRNAIATAIARGHGEEADAVRASARADSDQLEETRSALELLNRERTDFESLLKRAQAGEAKERAEQSAADALRAIGAVNDSVHEAAQRIFPLVREARNAIGLANSEDAGAKSLNGQQVTGFPRVGWFNHPGLEDLIQALDSFVHRQDVRVA